MTKEELDKKVEEQQSIIEHTENQIYSYVTQYIETLPYKVGDKVSYRKCDVCWIVSIVPEKYNNSFTGEIEVRVNPAKKDGTRSNRELVLYYGEIDSIKKIN